MSEMGNQIKHLQTKIIIFGLQEAFDTALNFNYRRPIKSPLYIKMDGQDVKKVTTIEVR